MAFADNLNREFENYCGLVLYETERIYIFEIDSELKEELAVASNSQRSLPSRWISHCWWR